MSGLIIAPWSNSCFKQHAIVRLRTEGKTLGRKWQEAQDWSQELKSQAG